MDARSAGDCMFSTSSTVKSTRSHRSRTLVVTGIALVSLLTLAGCADADAEPQSAPSSTVTESSTPRPAAAAVPASEEEAVAQATATLQEYTAMVNQVLTEGGVNPERIDAYATAVVRDEFVGSAQEIAKLGYTYEGGLTARVESGYATEAQFEGDMLDFGSVQLTFCSDSTGRTTTRADGTSPPAPADRAPRLEAGIAYDPTKGSWFVRTLTPLGTSCL